MRSWFEIFFILSAAVICLLVWYISPDRTAIPSKLQTFVAVSWIIFRRIVSFAGALLCIFSIYAVWILNENALTEKIFTSLAIFVVSVCFIFVGIVGFSKHGNSLELYKRIKKKYGIRW